ncbi:MAG: mucoidy inhibitor MuiA family protein [Sphaerospermopsis sp. SIO1G1]|nr:mucoidy inhibitor MuiA family protein [Sphaerospermopsis sp. SIO1G1]
MVNPVVSSWRKTIDSKIIAVTVYGDKALVTRRGAISLTGEERELLITPLPTTLEPESVRVSGSGVPVRLLGVSSDRIYTTEPVADRVTQLTRQIQQLESEKRHLQAQIDALALQSSFIAGLGNKTEEPYAQSLSRKNLSLSETLDFLNFLGSQYSEYAIASGECKSQQQELEKQLKTLRTSLQKIQTPHSQENLSISVEVEVTGTGEFELEISYVVNRASWKPLYDLRIDSDKNVLHLTYLAEVNQTTGEDWVDVPLTLSTAKLGLGALPPKLKPWYIDTNKVRTQAPLNAQRSMSPPPASAILLPDPAMFPKTAKQDKEQDFIDAEMIVTQASKQNNVVTFQLDYCGHIPTNGTSYKMTIFQADYPCHFNYLGIPSVVSFAYLQANVKNPHDGVVLLPGVANIFRNTIFVGTTQLKNIAPGQEFKINLGTDEGLKIERNLVERWVDKKSTDSQRCVTYSYRLVITNLLNQVAKLNLTEQLPISKNEQIQVRLTGSNPQIELGEMGILEWNLVLAPQQQQEVYYNFTVEHPPELTVLGLDI